MTYTSIALLLATTMASTLLHAAEPSEDLNHPSSSENTLHKDVQHDDAEPEEHADNDEEGLLELSDQSLLMAGVVVERLLPQALPHLLFAPGQVQLDQYSSAEVTPLVEAIVVSRQVKLGDEVAAGDALVTLSSNAVLEAQGQLMIAATEWQRVGSLGRGTVGASRFITAEVSYEQARLRLKTYGLDDGQIAAIAAGKRDRPLGQFDLVAPLKGTVLSDNFRVGQHIEPGQNLFLIADESRVWIEASLSPQQAMAVEVGMQARVKMNGHWHSGRVIQKHHLLDQITRTVAVRIAINPDGEHHHSGEFVEVAIATDALSAASSGGQQSSNTTALSLAVPEGALSQDQQGNWTVFVQVQPNHFRRTTVTREPARAGLVPISGLAAQVDVATSGAFYLAAELAKGSFDIHNH